MSKLIAISIFLYLKSGKTAQEYFELVSQYQGSSKGEKILLFKYFL